MPKQNEQLRSHSCGDNRSQKLRSLLGIIPNKALCKRQCNVRELIINRKTIAAPVAYWWLTSVISFAF